MSKVVMMKADAAKRQLTTILTRVANTHEPVILQSRGKALAAVISMPQFAKVEAQLRQLEDDLDWQDIQRSLADPANAKRIPWETVKRELHVLNRLDARRKAPVKKSSARPTTARRKGH